MDISGGLLAINVMPSGEFGEHKRCLTCKHVTPVAPGMTQTTLDLLPTDNSQEITPLPGSFHQKKKPLFEE